jgi:hypothetical protein
MTERLKESQFWREVTRQSADVDCRRHHHPINNQPGNQVWDQLRVTQQHSPKGQNNSQPAFGDTHTAIHQYEVKISAQ